MLAVTRTFEWDSAHRLLDHEGQCRSLHGHRYRAEISFRTTTMDKLGRVIDFGKLKAVIKAWIDEQWDHTTIVENRDTDLLDFVYEQRRKTGSKPAYAMTGPPTAELMAKELCEMAQELMNPFKVKVVRVKLYETPKCSATYEP